MIALSATPDQELRRRVREGTMACLKLNRRPHGHPLPVPRIRTIPSAFMLIPLLLWLRSHSGKPCMVFVPSIAKAEKLGILLALFSACAVCTGRSENRDGLIAAFKQGKFNVLVCTTVMERGMTIPGVQVCVFEADSRIFDEASLVQMAGRAGRTLSHPDGDVLFLCRHRSGKAEQCAVSLQEANACAA